MTRSPPRLPHPAAQRLQVPEVAQRAAARRAQRGELRRRPPSCARRPAGGTPDRRGDDRRRLACASRPGLDREQVVAEGQAASRAVACRDSPRAERRSPSSRRSSTRARRARDRDRRQRPVPGHQHGREEPRARAASGARGAPRRHRPPARSGRPARRRRARASRGPRRRACPARPCSGYAPPSPRRGIEALSARPLAPGFGGPRWLLSIHGAVARVSRAACRVTLHQRARSVPPPMMETLRRARQAAGAALALALASGCEHSATSSTQRPSSPLVGADISALARIEQAGGVFRDGGQARDAIAILRAHGANIFRLRLFVNPNDSDVQVNDLPYTVQLAGRVKAAGAKLLLDIHYSDTWADPGHQTTPAAWAGLRLRRARAGGRDLHRQRHDARSSRRARCRTSCRWGTRSTAACSGRWASSTSPAATPSSSGRSSRVCSRPASRACGTRSLRATPSASCCTTGRAGRTAGTQWFFDHMAAYGVPYDLIGLSYYPIWHGPLAALQGNLQATAARYGKDIVVVETSYPWRAGGWESWVTAPSAMAWPVSHRGTGAVRADLVRCRRGDAGRPRRRRHLVVPGGDPGPGPLHLCRRLAGALRLDRQRPAGRHGARDALGARRAASRRAGVAPPPGPQREREHHQAEDEQHQAPPQVHVDPERARVDRPIRDEPEDRPGSRRSRVNISPIGRRMSSFIAPSPEDDVEHDREPEHDDAQGGRLLVPRRRRGPCSRGVSE